MGTTGRETRPVETAIARYAAEEDRYPTEEVEKVYFHLLVGEGPLPMADGRTPPDGTRVWTAADWFKRPGERLFAAYAGDFQPRDAGGRALRTRQRLAVTAAQGGLTASGQWTEATDDELAHAFWIDTGSNTAAPVIEIAESADDAAMRDLVGGNGYGRARGTEKVDRPGQGARRTALALHLMEVADASGIEIRRDRTRTADDRGLPELLVHDDGGVTASLSQAPGNEAATLELIEEAIAIAAARAWQTASSRRAGERGSVRLDQAMVAGAIAGHTIVQSAGIRCRIAPTHDRLVRDWAAGGSEGTGRARDEVERTIGITAATEWSLQLPGTAHQRRRWQRVRAARSEGVQPVPAREHEASRPPAT